jgi:AraC-like DNA-binding protein
MAAGREHCNPDYRVARADFPCFGVEFVAAGRGALVINGHSFHLHAGSLFCYGPGIAHEIMADPAQPMIKYFADFFGEEAGAVLASGGLKPGAALQTLDVETFRILFEQFIAQGSQACGNTPQICASYLRIILLKAAECHKSTAPGLSTAAVNFHRWRDFIDGNFPRLRDLNDIAGELRVRPSYLCRVFKKFGHPSPYRYLTRKKLNLAAELLVGEHLPVKAAAMEAGYSDPYHFSRLFKAHFGHSPLGFVRLSSRK